MSLLGDLAGGIGLLAAPFTGGASLFLSGGALAGGAALGNMGMQLWQQDKAEDMARQSQQFNAEQAGVTRTWQEKMRATQYQVAVDDLKAAGLNPMLAYQQGGAGTPQGATASSSPGNIGQRADLAASMHSAAQIQVAASQSKLIDAEADKVRAETKEITERTPTHAASIDKMRQDIETSRVMAEKLATDIGVGVATAANLEQQTRNLSETIHQIHATVHNLQALTRLHGEQSAAARAQAEKYRQEAGLTAAQFTELQQRIRANLPQIQRAVQELTASTLRFQQSGHRLNAAEADSALGALRKFIEAINPLRGIINIGGH